MVLCQAPSPPQTHLICHRGSWLCSCPMCCGSWTWVQVHLKADAQRKESMNGYCPLRLYGINFPPQDSFRYGGHMLCRPLANTKVSIATWRVPMHWSKGSDRDVNVSRVIQTQSGIQVVIEKSRREHNGNGKKAVEQIQENANRHQGENSMDFANCSRCRQESKQTLWKEESEEGLQDQQRAERHGRQWLRT